MSRIGVIGAGSWGTALATVVASKGHDIKIFDVDEKHLRSMQEHHENMDYLPGVPLIDNIKMAFTTEDAIKDAEVILFSAPAQHFRSALTAAREFIGDDVILINVAKGIEKGTHKRMSEIAVEVMGEDILDRYVVLSGPSHAEEVGRRMPTTVATASRNIEAAKKIQDLFMTDRFRVYTIDDVTGVELGGALKNIIALGAGISDGMGFGDNAKAALMTRGLAEITRLGLKLGARPETFAGLTGTGDLIVTCTSVHSRNHSVGERLGKGEKIEDILASMQMVAEGVWNSKVIHEFAQSLGVEMPICDLVYSLCYEGYDAKKAVNAMMTRELKSE